MQCVRMYAFMTGASPWLSPISSAARWQGKPAASAASRSKCRQQASVRRRQSTATGEDASGGAPIGAARLAADSRALAAECSAAHASADVRPLRRHRGAQRVGRSRLGRSAQAAPLGGVGARERQRNVGDERQSAAQLLQHGHRDALRKTLQRRQHG